MLAALADDLNTAGAITALHDLARAGDAAGLKASAQMIGLLGDGMGDWIGEKEHWLQSEPRDGGTNLSDVDLSLTQIDVQQWLGDLLGAHFEARQNMDYFRADEIRDGLSALGIPILIKKDGLPEIRFKDPAFAPSGDTALLWNGLHKLVTKVGLK